MREGRRFYGSKPKFRQLRKEKGFTQEELAKAVGIQQQAISQWERGETLPQLEILPKLADVLECDFLTIAECFVKVRRQNSDKS